MITFLFRLAIVMIPFTGIVGLKAFGELQHEVSAYVFVATLALSVFPVLAHFRLPGVKGQADLRVFGLPRIALLVFGVILMSFIANFVEMQAAVFNGRSGMDKFVSSNLLVLYGFMLALLTYYVSKGWRWDDLIVKPIVISVFICAFFSFFEIGARWFGIMDGVYQFLSSIVYDDVSALEWDLRLRSVAFEPPDFANTAGYFWSWLLAGVPFSRGAWRITLTATLLVLSVMIILSDTRTSLVVITGLAVIFILLRTIFLPRHHFGSPDKMILPFTILSALLIPSLLILFTAYYDQIVYNVIADDRVSNITRLASITASFNMFEARPIFGFGFGQYAFHMIDYLPSWSYYSWELRTWLLGSTGYWPVAYSVYGRFAADMGLFGPLMWIGIWLWLARATLLSTLGYRKATGELPFASYPLIMGCFGVLLSGVPNDSVRSPMIWITMGLACRYIYETRQATVLLHQKKRETPYGERVGNPSHPESPGMA